MYKMQRTKRLTVPVQVLARPDLPASNDQMLLQLGDIQLEQCFALERLWTRVFRHEWCEQGIHTLPLIVTAPGAKLEHLHRIRMSAQQRSVTVCNRSADANAGVTKI